MKRNIIPVIVIILLVVSVSIGLVSVSVYANTVNDAPRARITGISTDQTIENGTEMDLSFELPEGARVRVSKWSSADSSVAGITRNGHLKAKKRGKTRLSLYLLYRRGFKLHKENLTAQIYVGEKVEAIKLTGEHFYRTGQILPLSVKIQPASAVNKRLKYESSNENVLAVAPDGKIRAVGKGFAEIHAVARDGSGCEAKLAVGICDTAVNSDTVITVAHRGLMTQAPENTVSAFKLAGKAGFAAAECDVRETAPDENGQSELIICHDKTLWAMTGESLKIKDTPYSEIRDLEVTGGANADKYHEHICLYTEYLDVMKKYEMSPVIELKSSGMSPASCEKIVAELQKRDLLDHASFVSFHEENLELIKRYTGGQEALVPLYYLVKEEVKDEAKKRKEVLYAQNSGYTGIGFEGRTSAETFKYANACGLKTNTWGFSKENREEFAALVKDAPVNMVTIDERLDRD